MGPEEAKHFEHMLESKQMTVLPTSRKRLSTISGLLCAC